MAAADTHRTIEAIFRIESPRLIARLARMLRDVGAAEELAQLHAENDRLRKVVHELEAENLNRRQKRSRPDLLRGTTRRIETPLPRQTAPWRLNTTP